MTKSLITPDKHEINLDKIETIEVVRSFSKKIQLKQYEPIDLFASYKAVMKQGSTNEDIDTISKQLYEKAVNDVEVETSRYDTANNSPFNN